MGNLGEHGSLSSAAPPLMVIQRLTYIAYTCEVKVRDYRALGSAGNFLFEWLYRGVCTVLRSIYLQSKAREHGLLPLSASS